MKPVKIVNYLKDSFEGKPSFIILMSDNIKYISNGCIFAPISERRAIEKRYNCKERMAELFAADGIDDNELEASDRMYKGCKGITKPGDYPKLKHGWGMYYGCKELMETGKYPNLVNGPYMYVNCEELTEPGKYPKLVDERWMYYGCEKLKQSGLG